MSILDKLGLAQKKNPGAPVIGEKKKQKERASSPKYNIYVRILIIASFLGVLVVSIPQPTFEEPINYTEGEPWRAENLTAPFDFAIQKSEEEIEEEREAIRESTAPIFYRQPDIQISVHSKIDSVFQNLQSVFSAYADWQSSLQNQADEAEEDSLAFIQSQNNSQLSLSDQAWNVLLENYWQTAPQNQQTQSETTEETFVDNFKTTLENLTENLLQDGVVDISKDEVSGNEITIRNLRERTEQTRNIANVRDLQEAREYIVFRLSNEFNNNIAQAGSEIFNLVFEPNLSFDQEETQSRINEALSNISTTKGAVGQGEIIIRKGDIVTEEKLNILQSLADARAQTATTLERWLRYGGDVLAIFAIVTIFFFYLYLYRKSIFGNNAMLLLVLIAMSLICVGSSIVYGLDISPYIVPVAIAPIILTIIFDSRVGLIATITLALLTGLIHGNNFEYVTATIVACTLGLFSVRDIKKRSQFFFTTPGIVFICYALVIAGFNMTGYGGWSALLNDFQFVVINAIFILFTYPLILLFEKSFNVTTDFTLIELSDTNVPLLKDLMTRAPGTFHHSLQVANLAEAAAGAIGANGLLCRVGALYHDIGKMENPGYFTENQTGTNEHDKLKPRMSALVIKAHVNNGVKLAQEHGLPELIIDFIKTHHGTSTIKFFYEKAKERADSNKDEIQEKDFKYDGPLPYTKETGILLLADGVEAASRAMKDPNYQKLDSLITKMVDERVYEGQLSKTPLTFQDLRAIKESFLNILVGIYHSRVEYPEDKEGKEKETDKKKKPEEPYSISKKEDDGEAEEPPPKIDDYYNS